VKKFSRIMAIISFILVMALLFTACGKKVSTDVEENGDQLPVGTDINEPPADDESPKIKEIKQAGKIVLGTSADYPPYEFHKEIDGKDTIVGFDIEIAKAIAKDLGVELEIKDMDFDGLLLALNAGKVDFVIAGMTPDPERDVEFSKIYYNALQGLLVHADNKDVYKTIDDLTGKRIGAQKGAIQEKLAKKEIKDLKLKALNKIPDLVLEVKHKNKCRGHIQCDSIIMHNAHVSSTPEVSALHQDAQLIHEAAIGRIASDQLIKLMSLGLSEAEAEETILKGFLK
jgi:ABC-type amino acid transport substrate-binding protein